MNLDEVAFIEEPGEASLPRIRDGQENVKQEASGGGQNRDSSTHIARTHRAARCQLPTLHSPIPPFCYNPATMPKLPPSEFFPPVEEADADGLLALGGSLEPEWLLDAYQQGIFPWPVMDDPAPIAWWSPDPRAIIELDGLHVSRRLRRTRRSGRFSVTRDKAFATVIHGCANAGDREGQTWITPRMIDAYCRLHLLGHAHSVEAWHQGKLAGGVYGLAMGGMFAGESKFHTVRDASKVALVHLVDHLRDRGYQLFDIQQLTPHTARLGGIEIPRREYLARLADALATPAAFGDRTS